MAVHHSRRVGSTVPAGGGGAIVHGRQITAANTGHTSYLDPELGRFVVDGDLTVHEGLVSMSDFVADGGVLTRRWFRGGLVFDRTDVTLTACRFDTGMTNYYAGTDHPFSASWCTVDTPGAAGDDGIASSSYTAYRCRIGGHSDGAKTNGVVSIVECFIRVEGQNALDHNDGCQNYAGAGPVSIVRSNIDTRPTNGVGAPNAALFCADGATGLQTWHDNWVAGGGYVMRCYESATYDVQGNEVLDASWVYGAAARAVIGPESVEWGTVRPNVVVDTAGVVLSTITAP